MTEIVFQRELSPLAVEWLELLPPVLRGDPWIQAILQAHAKEMQRLIQRAADVAAGFVPTMANEYTLAIWESLLGLPVNPPNTDVETRRGLVVSRLLRGDGSGAQWERAMSGATNRSYRYSEYGAGYPGINWYTLGIRTALPPGVTIEGLTAYVRKITPANLHFYLEGGQTYADVKAQYGTYQHVRDGFLNYDNMRYGVAT